MPSPNTRTCPACGTVMPASFPEGLCPKCLLKAATPQESDRTLPVAAPISGAPLARPGGVPSLETLRGLFPELEILSVLGAGGMGAVYQARQQRLNRLVALKIMICPPGHETDFALRFEREAQVLARLNHPHIVILYDFGELGPERTGADPLFYFLMEFVDGTDLGQLIKSKELKPTQALAIVPQICEALQYAHDQGITHRDIKPANILLDKKGTVKIADFGLAKMVTGTEEALMTGLTQTGTAMGTPHYMAPEQWEHPELVDHRADIYALGVVFYEMLTGERPAGVFEPPSKKTKPPVDRKLDGVVMRAMDKNPDRRYQQAGQIGDDVTRISGANKRKPATTGVAAPKHSSLKPLLAIGIAAALAVGGWMLWQGRAAGPPAAVPPETAQIVAAEFPPGQWVKVMHEPGKLPGALAAHEQEVWNDGWLTAKTNSPLPGVNIPRFEGKNQGIRLRVRQQTGNASSSICQLWVRKGTAQNSSTNDTYRLSLQTSGAVLNFWENKSLRVQNLHAPQPQPLAPGEEVTLELFVIGQRLIARCGGRLLPIVQDARLTAGAPGLQILHEAREVEVISLDGLSEVEALKLAGVSEVQLAAAASSNQKAAAEFPAGQWTNVLTTQAEVDAIVGLKGKVTLKPDGWLDFSVPKDAPGVGLTAFSAANAGVRVKLRIADRAPQPTVAVLTLRHTTTPPPRQEGYRLQILSGGSANPNVSLAHYDGLTRKTNIMKKQVRPSALQAGDEMILEFYTIGSRLIGRVNGELLPIAEDQRLTRGVFTLQTGHLVRDIELINLDSLSEAEALKLAGVESAVTTITASKDRTARPLATAAPEATFTFGSSRYALVNEGHTWPEARKLAEASGGRLAVFETEAEESGVREHVRPYLESQMYWIGGFAEEGSRNIRWLNDQPVGNASWGRGHPGWRTNAASQEVQTLGRQLCAVGVSIIKNNEEPGRWMYATSQERNHPGYLIEWDDAATQAVQPAFTGRLRAFGTMLNGRPLDLTKLAAYDDFVDVAGGMDSWVALRANGETVSSDGKADFQGIRKIARSFLGYHCLITESGEIRFHSKLEMPLSDSLKGRKVADAACGSHHGVALLEDGQAVVFGRRYEAAMEDASQAQGLGTPRWPQPEAAALQNVKGVAVTYTHAATLHHDGTVSVWGWEGPVQWQPEPELQPVRQISSFHDALHLLDETGQVWSFPLPRSAHPQQPVGFNGRLKPLGKDAVRLRDHLWLNADGTWRAVQADRPTMETLESATLRTETNFALLASISGAKPFGYALWIEPKAEAPAQAAPSAFKGRLRGSGFHLDGKPLDLKNAEGITDFVQVILTDRGWVGLRANGEQVSPEGGWSSKNVARLLPSWFNSFAIIDRDGRLTIARTASDGVKAIPEDVQRIGVVDACWDGGQAIALLKDGSVRVWGEHYTRDHEGPKWPAPPAEALQNVRQIAITHWHAATLRDDGKWFVWGGYGGSSGPFDLEPFAKWGEIADIQSGFKLFRVLTRSGEVYNLGGSRPLTGGLVTDGVVAIYDHLMQPKGSSVWTWDDKSRSSAQAEVDALLRQIGNRPRDAFDLRIVGDTANSHVAAVWIEPVEADAKSATPTTTTTKAAPFVNSLGMKFVPVPITGGPTEGQRVLFSIWETRLQDYEAFVKETKREWPKPGFPQETTHPACMVTLGDAEAFCLWLTERERKAGKLPATATYRLPSDHEWSCAIGIGAQEDADLSSWDKSGKLPGHSWGSAWPPPTGAGNFNGDEAPWSAAGGKLTGYRDAFPNTGPVGSFAANALGLHDLIGNVWELCPKPDSHGQQSILRGGSCQDVQPDSLTSSKRGFQSVDKFHSNIGFRVVLELAPSGSASASPSLPVSPSSATLPPFTDREAAEWVLGLGYDACNVKVLKGGKVIEVRKLADLPAQPFVIQEVRVNLNHKQQAELWAKVTDAVVLRLAGLRSLKIVDLRGNVTGASLKVMAHHPGLEALLFEGLNLRGDELPHLRGSRLQSLGIPLLRVADPDSLAVLATMPNLRDLQFDGCLDPALAAALPKLPKLEILRANNSANTTDDVLPLVAERFPQLSVLQHWGAKKLKGSTLGSLMALKSLTTLGLTDTSVNDEALAQIAGMPHLLSLELGQTRITDACLPTLKTFPKLEALHIFQTELTDAALLELATIPTLKKLVCKMQVITNWKPGVTFTAVGIAAFEKLRPDVQVVK